LNPSDKSSKQLNELVAQLSRILQKKSQVMFAYLHGSALTTENPRDIDIAVYLFNEIFNQYKLNAAISLDFAIPLEMELEKHLHKPVDLQVLNQAPLAFRHRVIKQGRLMVDKNSDLRCDFEYLSRVQYFDFKPRIEEYLREVVA